MPLYTDSTRMYVGLPLCLCTSVHVCMSFVMHSFFHTCKHDIINTFDMFLYVYVEFLTRCFGASFANVSVKVFCSGRLQTTGCRLAMCSRVSYIAFVYSVVHVCIVCVWCMYSACILYLCACVFYVECM
jgi:hypothetical protein